MALSEAEIQELTALDEKAELADLERRGGYTSGQVRERQQENLTRVESRAQTGGHQGRQARNALPQARAALDEPLEEADYMTPMQRFTAAMGGGMVERGAGISQASNLFPSQGQMLADSLRGEDPWEQRAERDQNIKAEIGEARERDAPLKEYGSGAFGNMMGHTAVTLPLAAMGGSAPAMIGEGAVMGMTEPRIEGESFVENTLTGGGLGLGLNRAGGTLGRIANPQTSADAQELIANGVELTPNQALGGAARKAEEGLRSVPLAGSLIAAREMDSLRTWNTSVYNKILEPLGETTEGAGRSTLKEVGERISRGYDEVYGSMDAVPIDTEFAQNIGKIREMAKTFPEAYQKQLDDLLNTEVYGNLTPAQTFGGETYGNVASRLKKLGSDFRGSANAHDRQLGSALDAVQEELSSLVGRVNPDAFKEISKVNDSYSMLVRVEDAMGSMGATNAPEGIFTPAHLLNAAKKGDGRLNKRDWARGDALLQPYAQISKNVLGNTVPDSGTAVRNATLGALGLGGATAANAPLAIGSTLALTGMYTKPMNAFGRKLVSERPEAFRKAGDALRKAMPYALPLAENYNNE